MTLPSSSDDSGGSINVGLESLLGVGAKVLGAALGFVSLIILSRELGPDGLGKYAFLLSTTHVCTFVATGLSKAAKKRVSEPDTSETHIMSVCLLISAIVAVIILSGLALIQTALPEFLRFTLGDIVIITVSVLFIGWFRIITSTYAALGRPGYANWVQTGQQIGQVGTQIPLAILGFSPAVIVLGVSVPSLLAGLVLIGRLQIVPTVPTRQSWTQVASFARWSIPNQLVEEGFRRGEYLCLWLVSGAASVGYLNATTRLTIPALLIAESVGWSLAVSVSQQSSRSQVSDALDDVKRALQFSGVIAFPLAVGGFILAEEVLLTLYGGEYVAARAFLISAGLQIVFRSYRVPLAAALDGLNTPNLRFSVLSLGVVVKAGLFAAGWSLYGVYGILAAVVLSEFFVAAGYWVCVNRRFDGLLTSRGAVVQTASATVMGGVVFALKTQVTHSLVTLIGLLAAGVCVYGMALLALSPRTRQTLRWALQTI